MRKIPSDATHQFKYISGNIRYYKFGETGWMVWNFIKWVPIKKLVKNATPI